MELDRQSLPGPPEKERGEAGAFRAGGASIVYVHTFCSQLMGETAGLDLCRTEVRQNCDIDVLSWFKLSPSESPTMMSSVKDLEIFFHYKLKVL